MTGTATPSNPRPIIDEPRPPMVASSLPDHGRTLAANPPRTPPKKKSATVLDKPPAVP